MWELENGADQMLQALSSVHSLLASFSGVGCSNITGKFIQSVGAVACNEVYIRNFLMTGIAYFCNRMGLCTVETTVQS